MAPGMTGNLRIDIDRLMARLDALARIGAIEGGGVCRLALTDEDRAGRDLVVGWMRELGLTVTVDAVGNVFGRRAGRTDGKPVMTGSHIDTVRTGGRYDGNYGVLAGLEAVETLNRAGIETARPIAIAFFTNEEVNAISQNTGQISKITDAISRIASQTNMLSLNAAIEAARAGEYGRGFAVVAEEIRKLAEHSGQLAQEIAELVKKATTQAQRGVAVADKVSGNMQDIAEAVRKNDNLMGAIAAAMEEQQTTVGRINANVSELTRIGQSNAAASEEITATMIDLSRLAEQTRGQAESFGQRKAA
jgi:putative aminopeptidase FrvX